MLPSVLSFVTTGREGILCKSLQENIFGQYLCGLCLYEPNNQALTRQKEGNYKHLAAVWCQSTSLIIHGNYHRCSGHCWLLLMALYFNFMFIVYCSSWIISKCMKSVTDVGSLSTANSFIKQSQSGSKKSNPILSLGCLFWDGLNTTEQIEEAFLGLFFECW